MKETGPSFSHSEKESQRETVQTRWEKFEPFRNGTYTEITSIPEHGDWSEWQDWSNLLTSFAPSLEKPQLYISFKDKKEQRSEKEKNFLAMLTTLFVNPTFFNKLREQFPNEDYLDAWNAFFRIAGDQTDTVDLHKGLSLSGIDLHGLSPGPIMNEFARMEDANLRDTDFTGANLKNAVFDKSDARGAVFNDAQLYGASFEGTLIEGASFEDASAHRLPRGLPNSVKDKMNLKF